MKNIEGIRLGGRAPSEESCHGTESDLKKEKEKKHDCVNRYRPTYLSIKKKKKKNKTRYTIVERRF